MALSGQAALKKDLRTGRADMQHRHYTTIAAIIRDMPDDIRERVTDIFTHELRYTNSNFDAGRFRRACNPD